MHRSNCLTQFGYVPEFPPVSTAEFALININCAPLNSEVVALGITKGVITHLWNDVSDVSANRMIDLGGATVLPGIDDSHLHGYEFGRSLTALDVRTSAVPNTAALNALLAHAKPEKTGWVRGIGWDDSVLRGTGPNGSISAADIDAVTPDIPVMLGDVTGHQALCNSAALRAAGISAATEDPPGGSFIRDQHGAPTGLIYEAAVARINAAIPLLDRSEQAEAILAAQENLLSRGVVAYTDPGLGPGAATLMDGTGDLRAVEVYERLAQSEELTMRINLMLLFGGLGGTQASDVATGLDQFGAQRPMAPGGTLGISQLKVFADGIPRSRTAWMTHPYDDCTHGHLQVAGSDDEQRVAEIHAIVAAGASRGWQVGLHTIGDLAISHVLDAVTESTNRPADLRHYIIHGDFVNDADLGRMASHGVTLNANPSIRWAVGGSVAPIVGTERNNGRQRLRTAVDAGVNVCGSSDAPVADPDWRVIVAAAMTRSWRSDPQRTDDQRLTAAEAIRAVTKNAAWQSHAETWRGEIAVGKVADLVIMDAVVDWNEPWSLPGTQVRATMVGGRFVYGDLVGAVA